MGNQHQDTREWVSDRFLSTYFEVSRITIWKWAKNGNLPRPHKIGPNCTRWRMSEIIAAKETA